LHIGSVARYWCEHSALFADSSLKSFGTIVQYFFPISPKVLSMVRLRVRVGS
jgi:hypothetical protein